MQKKIKFLFLSLIAAMFMILPVCAEGSNTYRMVDQANLLTDQEETERNQRTTAGGCCSNDGRFHPRRIFCKRVR